MMRHADEPASRNVIEKGGQVGVKAYALLLGLFF